MAYKNLREKFEEFKSKKGVDAMSKEALNWFYDYTNKFAKSASFTKTASAGKMTFKPVPGKFYLYRYDPKTKDTMEYYDSMPLVLITDVTADGWYGINFHYMPPAARLAIMEGFYKTIQDPSIPARVKLRSNWGRAVSVARAASSHQFLQHSIKRYLNSHIASPLIELDPEYWAMCVFLPLSRFKKKSASFAWGNI
jgi:hypothetical protein